MGRALGYKDFDNLFRNNNFPAIEQEDGGLRYLKVRSLSRGKLLHLLFQEYGIDEPIKKLEWAPAIFDSAISDKGIDEFIIESFKQERAQRKEIEDDIIDQLNRLQVFDWGGSFQNSLEKHIVDQYVKKYWTYDSITQAIAEPIMESVRGYTLNSWYNHWSSILIEDIFKEHKSVLPTVGRIEKVDFFIGDTPFDLKVTYFPEELMKAELKKRGFGVELTKVKKQCRSLNIFIPTDYSDKQLLVHLYNKLCEDGRSDNFINELNGLKKETIREYEKDPQKLKVWLYENQGEKRFDASNRLFLVLTDENNYFDSWKMKRQIPFLRREINSKLNEDFLSPDSLKTKFRWEKTKQDFECKSGIIFINKA